MKVSEICKYAPKSNIKARDACDGGKYVFLHQVLMNLKDIMLINMKVKG